MNALNQKQGSNEIYNSTQSQSNLNSEINRFNHPVPMINPITIPQGQIQQSPIIVNQITQPKVIYIDTTKIKTSSFGTVCPICNGNIQTIVKKKCNWYSCVLCYCVGLLSWVILQCCRNKELNCNNAEHFCPRCGNKIAEYNSC